MNRDALILGLEFSSKHMLTTQEIAVLQHFVGRPFTARQLGHIMNTNPVTLHNTIQRLRMKNLVVVKAKEGREKIYAFNEECIKEEPVVQEFMV